MGNDRDYQVGYRRPPRDKRFPKGRSGNPQGRPKGVKNLATLLDQVLREPVIVTERGKRNRITKREAMLKQLVNKAAAGDAKSIQLLLGEIRTIEARVESTPSAGGQLEEADRQVLRQIYERLQGPPAGGEPNESGVK